jgi:CheY-like chemotaxis protein
MDRLLSRLLGEGLTLQLQLQSRPLFVHMDPTQMQQVIINLITNARDAMNGGGTVCVDTSTVELHEPLRTLLPGTYALLRVTDTGSGMDAATRQRIFEPFFTTKEVGKGTGLGLSMAYGIVEQGGGYIDVSSEPSQGSSFRVYLPLAQAPARPLKEKLESGTSGFRPITRARRSAVILLVEDEPAVRAVTRRILEAAGHRVLTSASAELALEVALKHSEPIDLLVTDVVMAAMDGPTLAARLRSLRPELKTLFISGYSRDHVLPPDEPQLTGFLAKPFAHDALLAKVAELLSEASHPQLAVAPRQ